MATGKIASRQSHLAGDSTRSGVQIFGMNDARYAYHEAGHAVAAAVLGFPFRLSGIHIDQNGLGVTQVVCPFRRCSPPFSPLQMSQVRMVVVLLAGLLAQQRFFPDSTNKSAADDDSKVEQYLSAIYRADETAKSAARDYFRQEAGRLVNTFQDAIAELGERLWSREYTPRKEDWGTPLPQEKTIDSLALGEILKAWNLSCHIDDNSKTDDSDSTVAVD